MRRSIILSIGKLMLPALMLAGVAACTDEPANARLGTPVFDHRPVDPTNNSQNT